MGGADPLTVITVVSQTINLITNPYPNGYGKEEDAPFMYFRSLCAKRQTIKKYGVLQKINY